MSEAKKMWVCMYFHTNGTDVSVHETEASANANELALMVDGLKEIEEPETRLAIIREILSEQYAKAFQLYAEATDESFETTQKVVITVRREDALAEMRERYIDDTGA